MKKMLPWSIAFSALTKLVIVLLLVAQPSCAHAQNADKDLPAAEAQAVAKKVETYLNSITTIKSRFTQMNQDGSMDSGEFYLSRPGRLRFQYDAPKSDYIVADGLLIHYWDNGIKNYSNTTIGSTPADFLLAKKIQLSGKLKVVSVRRPQQNKLVVTLVQRDEPEAGDVKMLLTENPMQLQKWRVTDGGGNIAETTLSNVQTGVRIDPTLFRFAPPKGYDAEWKNTR